jgi:hypothetical protein
MRSYPRQLALTSVLSASASTILFDRVDCGQIVFHSSTGALKSLEGDAMRSCVNRCGVLS